MVLTIHHLGHSQSDTIVWLCEELGLDYKLEKYDRSPLLSPPKLIALHPIGAAPVIEDDGGVKIAERAACVEYIIQTHGDGRLTVKPGAKNYADYLYWLAFANGTFQPALGRVMTLRMAGVGPDDDKTARVQNKVDQVLQYLDHRLGESKWLAGEEFTAADVMTVFSLTGMREFLQYDLSPYKNILDYLQQRVLKREGYRKAMQKGDPDIDVESLMNGPPPLPVKALRAKH